MWNGMELVVMLQDLRAWTPDWFDAAVCAASDMLYLVLPVALALGLFWCVDKRWGGIAVLSMSLSLASVSALKGLLCVPRPWDLDARVVPYPGAAGSASGLSCPSGHAAVSAGVFSAAAMAIRTRLVAILCAATVAVAAVSRVYLGVHTPLDVVAGIVLGLAVACASVLAFGWMERGEGRDAWVLAAALAIILTAMVATFVLPSGYADGHAVTDPAVSVHQVCKYGGLASGAVVGWFLERRLVGSEAGGRRRWGKLILGLTTSCAMLAVPLLSLSALGSADLGLLIGGAAFSLYGLCLYPWVAGRLDL